MRRPGLPRVRRRYRTWHYTYEQVRGAAYTFGARLRRERISKGDKVIVWGESRPEWIVALWDALSERVIVVPIDYRSSASLVQQIQSAVQPRAIVIGDDVALAEIDDVPVWRVAEMDWSTTEARRDGCPSTPADTAEIIFTSGATAEPKGVVITHRNVLANIIPIEREVAKYRPLAWPFSRPLPRSPAAQSHVRPSQPSDAGPARHKGYRAASVLIRKRELSGLSRRSYGLIL